MSRFSLPQDPVFQQLNTSLGYDRRLWPHDIAQSRAHATMLAAQQIISEDERDEILRGLDEVAAELEGGAFDFEGGDEDIHMAVERRLTEIVGRAGGKLHTARSRNDQVVTDLAMFVRTEADATARLATDLATTLIDVAEAHLDWPLPGYTHLQRAQPVYLSHHLLAYVWMLLRDRARLRFTADQASLLPLGAGALAGVNFDTDRRLVARELGFDGVVPNSIDAVSNRDFAFDLLHALSVCATHLSRLGSELVIWSSEEFGFVTMSDAWSSGSSIMPQKRNPDVFELLRGRTASAHGCLVEALGIFAKLPSGYQRDLQLLKAPLFRGIDLALASTGILVPAIDAMGFRVQHIELDPAIHAAERANELVVREGIPFREAYRRVGAALAADRAAKPETGQDPS